jgi:short-subunit dehydrogenase
MNLNSKIVVITGASDGIGKQIALRLAKDGVQLALIARDEKRLEEVCQQSKQLGALNAKYYVCDIRQTDKLENVVSSIIADLGNIDILINNAGIWQKLMPVEKIKKDIINEVIETNLTALIQLTRICLPTLKTREESAIINIISKSGVIAQEGQSVYSASKYGVQGFTEVLKEDLKDSNVRVAGIYQGGTNTKMFEKSGDNPPIEKFTNPSDLADVISYMLSLPKKIWIHDIRVDR